jgi:hypothetical protein
VRLGFIPGLFTARQPTLVIERLKIICLAERGSEERIKVTDGHCTKKDTSVHLPSPGYSELLGNRAAGRVAKVIVDREHYVRKSVSLPKKRVGCPAFLLGVHFIT